MTLPLGLLHDGVSPRDGFHPPWAVVSVVHSHLRAFQSHFSQPLQIVRRCYRVGQRSSGWGGFPLPEKKGFVVGFAAGFLVVEFAAASPLPSPAMFEHLRGS